MARPSKPFEVLIGEKKSHRTKAELAQRRQGEDALITGRAMRERPEVKADPVAHREFLRVNSLLKGIQKNDAIYEPVINRYCLLYAESLGFEEKREAVYASMLELEEDKDKFAAGGDLGAYYQTKASLQNAMLAIDRQIQAKRKMMFDLEKENIMTIAAALRSVPKKVEKPSSALLKAINGD